MLMAVLALVLDGGLLRDNRRRVQTAADMAALAAVTELFTNYSTGQGLDANGTAKQSALNIASTNGFNNDGVKNTVTVNLNPSVYQGGEWKGQTIPPGYVEVIITYKQPAYFSSIWGTGNTQVSARAVARGTWQQASAGIHVLSNSGTSLSAQDNPTVHTDGHLVTNSNDDNARDDGGRGSFDASQFFFSDGAGHDDSYHNPNTGNSDSNIINHSVPATPDPLAVLPAPSQPPRATTPDGQLTYNLNWSGDNSYGAQNGQLTLRPGTYTGGIAATSGSLVLQPGIYYLTGSGLSLSGNASVTVSGPSSPDTGTGVHIYFTPGSGGNPTPAGGGGGGGDGHGGGDDWGGDNGGWGRGDGLGKASPQLQQMTTLFLVALVGGSGGG
jgi:hypothetical protein